jgi:hypothetical protein
MLFIPMNTELSNETSLIPWKVYLTTTAESLLAFYLATFSLAMFYINRGSDWVPAAILLGVLYLFIIFVCAKRVIEKLPISAVMLIIPIAPLIVIIMVISLIPILQVLGVG